MIDRDPTAALAPAPDPGDAPRPVWVWGVPFAPLTRAEAAAAVAGLIDARRPAYFITANTHYAMLTSQHPELGPINDGAAFVLADGTPLVKASRWLGTPLPERVAGSDLIYDLCEQAAARGDRVFFLGGAEGIAEAAARRMEARYPGLPVAGTACPAPGDLVGEAGDRLVASIRESRPDLLLVAFGQPKGEAWIARHLEALGVPACVQVGASLDFLAGRVRRAPRWIQKIGMEWAYRMYLEPGRLAPRYARNALFLARMIGRDRRAARARGRSSS